MLAYADDIVVTAKSEERMKEMIKNLERYMKTKATLSDILTMGARENRITNKNFGDEGKILRAQWLCLERSRKSGKLRNTDVSGVL